MELFPNWNYNKEKISLNNEHYGRVLSINEKESVLLFLHTIGDPNEVKEEKIYALKYDPKDLEYYKKNLKAQKFCVDFESRSLASNEKGNKPLTYVEGPRVEIITSPNYPIFLKTKSI